ncbi:hypothetical protein R3P38DRAFT_1505978 [Favolaschia claudopus]|uniref:Ribosomal protein S3 n=1 Tax=Favolaschia claudopus TaxID=2862362 RepID=A0AAW0AMD8_9AGAR
MFSPFFTRWEDSYARWPGRTGSIWKMPWAKNVDAFKRAGASWRRMLVTQPPVRSLFLKYVTINQRGARTRQATLSALSLRMGFLYDLILPLTQGDVWFWIDWHGAGGGHGHTSDSTIHLRKSIGCVINTRPVKRDTRFDSEEKQIVEITFRDAEAAKLSMEDDL